VDIILFGFAKLLKKEMWYIQVTGCRQYDMMRWGELEIRIREQERVKRVEETEMWKG
jgi:hypothetical protein